MKENKKVKNQPTQRLRYEAPQMWCLPIEAEGIMASSLTTGKSVGFDVGHGGSGMSFGQKGYGSETFSPPIIIGGGGAEGGGGMFGLGTSTTMKNVGTAEIL